MSSSIPPSPEPRGDVSPGAPGDTASRVVMWALSDTLLVLWSIIAAVSEGSGPLVWGPLVSAAVRKAWPLVEHVARWAARGRAPVLLAALVLNATSLVACAGVGQVTAAERDPGTCFAEAARVAAEVAAEVGLVEHDPGRVLGRAAVSLLALYRACLEVGPAALRRAEVGDAEVVPVVVLPAPSVPPD